jgi:hypothetical protein
MKKRPKRPRHAPHPTIERYSLCGVTHEGNETLPVNLAKPRQHVNCPSCRVVINFCKTFDSLTYATLKEVSEV